MQPRSNAPFVASGFGIYGALTIYKGNEEDEEDARAQGFWLAPAYWKSGVRIAGEVRGMFDTGNKRTGLQLDLVNPLNPNYRLRIVVERIKGRAGETAGRLMLTGRFGCNVELRMGDLEKYMMGDAIELEWIPAKPQGFGYFKGAERERRA
jgi:hypothetical protein